MVMSGRSVHLSTLFSWASLTKQLAVNQYFVHILSLVTNNNLLESAEGIMTVDIIS